MRGAIKVADDSGVDCRGVCMLCVVGSTGLNSRDLSTRNTGASKQLCNIDSLPNLHQ